MNGTGAVKTCNGCQESSPIVTNPYRPQYGGAFHCIGGDCEDTCCQSWTVPVDKATYEKYRAFPAGRLADITTQYVTAVDPVAPDSLFARINMAPSGLCPFFSAERLCDVQSEFGPDYLSATCSIYPRVLNAVDEVLELSLNLSCPEAARQVLLDPHAIEKPTELPETFRKDQFARLADGATGLFYKPYAYLLAFRALFIELLRSRQVPLWHRVTLIGDLCQRLHAIDAANEARDVAALLAEYHAMLQAGSFPDASSAVAPQPSLQLDVVLRLTDQRMRTGAPGVRFEETFQAFLQGIGYARESKPENDLRNFVHAEADYHRPFFAAHPFVMENYLLNYVIRTLFPFGRQASAHFSPLNILDEYLLFAAQYAWINGLLIGIAGRYREEFSAAHVIKAVQAFARAVEHDIEHRGRMLAYLKSRSLDQPQQMQLLLQA